MTRRLKMLLGCALGVVIAGVLAVAYDYLTREFRSRRAVLQPLLATNAALSDVIAKVGSFEVTRHYTLEWTQMVTRYKAGSAWDRQIAGKMDHASAVGHTSSISMQTWIFLDERDRLIDFALGTQ